jgi:hypothetical protein
VGLDMAYQAISADCDLVERCRTDEQFGELLCQAPHWFRDGPPRNLASWPEAARRWDELCRLASHHPGLAGRNCYLGRRWDCLHYLLSAKRRGGKETEDDRVLDRAILGEHVIAEHVHAPQGVPVKYVSPDTDELAASLLEPITADTLRTHCQPAQMAARAVYKVTADEKNESDGRYDADAFVAFRAFYLDAARHRDGVIVCLD